MKDRAMREYRGREMNLKFVLVCMRSFVDACDRTFWQKISRRGDSITVVSVLLSPPLWRKCQVLHILLYNFTAFAQGL
jgi:hypothetical protein